MSFLSSKGFPPASDLPSSLAEALGDEPELKKVRGPGELRPSEGSESQPMSRLAGHRESNHLMANIFLLVSFF